MTRGTMREARNVLTLTRARASGSGGVGVAVPQPTAQNEIIISDATPAWSLLAAPTAEGQVPITGADPYTPAWGTTFPAYMTFDTGAQFGGHIIAQTEDTSCGYLSFRYSDDAAGPYWSSRKARGSIASPVIANDNDTLWDFVAMGYDGAAWASAAGIRIQIDGTPGADDMPGEILFRTSPSGSDTPQARVKIRSTGVIEFYNGLAFGGATGVNAITVPDNAAQAVHLVDAGGIEYLRVVSTDVQPVVVLNGGGVDVDFRVEASGMVNAFAVRGSDGSASFGIGPGVRSLRVYRTGSDATFEIESATDNAILFLDAPADELCGMRFQSAGSSRFQLRRSSGSDDISLYSFFAGIGNVVNWEYDTGYTDAKYLLKCQAGLTLYGATGANVITIPDNQAQAMHLVDAGGIEYLRVVTMDGLPGVVFNEGGADVNYRIEASGQPNAFDVEGNTGWVSILTSSHGAPLEVNGAIWGARDTDTQCYFGRAAVGWCYVADQAAFGHVDAIGTTSYALKQTAAGATVLNAASGQMLYLDVGNVNRVNLAAGAVVFNEGGTDVDHRFEAYGEENALFIRGSDGKIGFWTTTLEGRVNIGGTAGPAMLNLPTNLSTIDAGLSTRDVADECIIVFGANVRSDYTGRTVTAEAGACIRCDTRDQDGGTTNSYTVFQVLTRAAGAAAGAYTVPFQVAAGAPTASLWITRAGNINIRENSATVRLTGTKEFAWTISDPEVGTVGQVRIPWACTVTRVDGNTVGGTSCTLNIEERSTLGSSGTNVLSSDMVADANGESVTSGFNNSSLAAGNYLTIDVSAVSGAVDEVTVNLTVTLV